MRASTAGQRSRRPTSAAPRLVLDLLAILAFACIGFICAPIAQVAARLAAFDPPRGRRVAAIVRSVTYVVVAAAYVLGLAGIVILLAALSDVTCGAPIP